MALDDAAAQNAKCLLNGIDDSALIGGPLTAAITAQAMAARSTYEFIKEVGLQSKEGVASAANVTFMYQKDGEMVKLIVPILTIVPIPLIVIDDIDIQFKASISASASQSSEDGSSQSMGGDPSASASGAWGPFSVSAKIDASDSGRKDSKTTQDSKCSVESAHNVHVHASQAGMPAGLATVLNILSSAAGTGTRDGSIKLQPATGSLDLLDPAHKQSLMISCTDSNGLNLKDTEVVLEGIPDYVVVGEGHLGTLLPHPAGKLTIKTDEKGACGLQLWIEDKEKANGQKPFQIVATAKVGEKQKFVKFPASVTGALPPPPPPPLAVAFDFEAQSLAEGRTATRKLTVNATKDTKFPEGSSLEIEWSGLSNVADLGVKYNGEIQRRRLKVSITDSAKIEAALDLFPHLGFDGSGFDIVARIVAKDGGVLAQQKFPLVVDKIKLDLHGASEVSRVHVESRCSLINATPSSGATTLKANSPDHAVATPDANGSVPREMTSVPGIPCPQCAFRIRMSLADFLYSQKLTCPGCGLELAIDKSQCTRMVEHLQETHNADETTEKLRHQLTK